MANSGHASPHLALAQWLASHRLEFVAGFRHAIDSTCALHGHAAMEIVHHPRGSGRTVLADGRAFDFVAGDVVVYPADLMHDQRMAEAGEDFCVQLRIPAGAPSALADWWQVRQLDDPFAIGELQLLSRVQREDGPLEKLALDLRATALVARLAALAGRAAPRGGDDLADRARRWIRAHLHEIDSVQEVAEALAVSPDYLRHAFKKRHGSSLVRWLAEARIAQAKDLLLHSQMPLKDVARACAFANEQYFSAVFRKLTGTTPGAFRGRR
ncbi:MAG: helix-turn-helix transcriptional regulator [Planctomycetes bacterium]|nr:helix-turn-helix transcriptional regulator [Planctomycetota bacterium]